MTPETEPPMPRCHVCWNLMMVCTCGDARPRIPRHTYTEHRSGLCWCGNQEPAGIHWADLDAELADLLGP